MLLGMDWSGRWTYVDRLLAQALIILEKSMCSGCGQSLLRSADEDCIGHMEVHEVWCEACDALEKDKEIADKQPFARKPFVVDTGL